MAVAPRSEGMGDLPDMAARVAEARGANSPRPVDRAVQELDSALLQFLAFRVDVVDVEGELEPDPCVTGRNGCGLDEPGRLTRLQEVDDGLAELEDGRVVVLENDR